MENKTELNLNLKEIAKLSNGTLNDEKYSDLMVDIVSIDTRTIDSGEMYMPIIGEKLDGHIFVEEAFKKGAVATFCEVGKCSNIKNHPIVWVKNSNEAFTSLAKNYRDSLENIKIIAITGSNGKTTTKDIIKSVLSSKYQVRKTIGNLNNQIGVPRTMLRFDKKTDIGVVEMGTDGFGQIEKLSNLASPDIAIITNIGDSHLHQLINKENVAKEKIHILDGLNPNGIFIYNLDDPVLSEIVKNTKIKQKIITFGQSENADYRINIIESNNNGNNFTVNNKNYITPLVGAHQVYNATVAIIIAELFEISYPKIIKSLEKEEISSMRSELISCNGFDILNDSYKSNPQSLASALETLYLFSNYSRKITILGDMLELGKNEIELHREVGRNLNPSKVDYILLYGPLSKYIAEEAQKNFGENRVFYFEKKDQLIDKAKYLIIKNSLVLVKASRSLRLEEIVEALKMLTII